MENELLITYEELEAGYGMISLNRPEKRNAISREMAEQLKETLEQARQKELKFLVITSSTNQMFSAGGDLHYLHGELPNEEAYKRLQPMLEVLDIIVHFPVPVIAVLNGNALGGGCELATACDIRIAKRNTKFGFIQTNIGILPGWGGGALLYKKVHPNFALEWIMSGEVLSAGELQDKGWIHHVIEEGNEDMEEILAPYLKKSKEQMHLLKAQFNANIGAEDIREQMEEESKRAASLWDSDAHKSALQTFSEKKK